MKKILLAALLIQIALFAGCSDDDTGESKGSLTVAVNGTAQDASIHSAKLLISQGNPGTEGHGLRTLNIYGLVGDDSLTIVLSNWDFQNPPHNAVFTKDYYNNYITLPELEVGESTETCMQITDHSTICDQTIIKYFKAHKIFASSLIDTSPILSLTKCDGKKASGTFSLTLQYPISSENMTIEATFTDVTYIIEDYTN